MKKQWLWSVFRVSDSKSEGGSEYSYERATTAAEYAHRELGPRGVTVKVTSPRGNDYFLCPKARTSGLKWERRP